MIIEMPAWALTFATVGAVLTCGTLLLAIVLVHLDFPPFGPSVARRARFSSREHWHNMGFVAPWIYRDKSSIRRLPGAPAALTTPVVRFHTLHCHCDSIGLARWALQVEFVVKNDLLNEIAIDDMHARIFEANAFAPPLATISYYGDVRLLQDNSILVERRKYSLAPDEGYRIKLHLEASRIEAAPVYGKYPTETKGRAVVVFGLLVDYYVDTGTELSRRVLPSDCIYLFEFPGGATATCDLRALDTAALQRLRNQPGLGKERDKFIDRLNRYLNEHIDFQATPRR